MVEQVARQLQYLHADMTGVRLSSEQARRYAARAIEAMREPTAIMAKIGDNYTNCGGPCDNRTGRRAWCAMIDEALRG